MMFGLVELALMLPPGRSPAGLPVGCLSRSARFLLKASPSDRRPLELALSSVARCSAGECLPCELSAALRGSRMVNGE